MKTFVVYLTSVAKYCRSVETSIVVYKEYLLIYAVDVTCNLSVDYFRVTISAATRRVRGYVPPGKFLKLRCQEKPFAAFSWHIINLIKVQISEGALPTHPKK